MKITKFAQSCILIETEATRILIDPGYIGYDPSFLSNEWKNINLILVTHKHGDHCHDEAINSIMVNGKTKFYSTSEVANAHPALKPTIVKAGDRITVGTITIEVVSAVHGYIPKFKQGLAVHENVGYIIDDGNTRAYQTSDTICFDNDYRCDIIFLPVVNHGLVMGPWEAARFAKETGAKLAVPIHYDNPEHPADFEEVNKEFDSLGMKYRLMNIKETIEF